MLIKALAIYATARAFGGANLAALRRTAMFAQGGEFAFVLYTAALAGGVIDARENALFSTVVILSMAITPLILIAAERLLRDRTSLDGVDAAQDLHGRILLIGFGRFGQIALQLLLLKGINLAVIDKDPDRIRDAGRWGFKVFFGDGTRLDTLRHSGAHEANAIMICVDDPKEATHIVELAKHEFPQARLLARSYDRGHALDLIRAGVDYQIRETVESAYLLGSEGLRALGFAEIDVEEAAQDIRQRDTDRLAQQIQGNMMSGKDHLITQPIPEPLVSIPVTRRLLR